MDFSRFFRVGLLFIGRAWVEIACFCNQSRTFPLLAFLLFSFNIAQVSIVIIILL